MHSALITLLLTDFEERNLVPEREIWSHGYKVHIVPILGPNHGILSKLNGPGPLGSGGYSHTSFSTGEFWATQRTLSSDVKIILNID